MTKILLTITLSFAFFVPVVQAEENLRLQCGPHPDFFSNDDITNIGAGCSVVDFSSEQDVKVTWKSLIVESNGKLEDLDFQKSSDWAVKFFIKASHFESDRIHASVEKSDGKSVKLTATRPFMIASIPHLELSEFSKTFSYNLDRTVHSEIEIGNTRFAKDDPAALAAQNLNVTFDVLEVGDLELKDDLFVAIENIQCDDKDILFDFNDRTYSGSFETNQVLRGCVLKLRVTVDDRVIFPKDRWRTIGGKGKKERIIVDFMTAKVVFNMSYFDGMNPISTSFESQLRVLNPESEKERERVLASFDIEESESQVGAGETKYFDVSLQNNNWILNGDEGAVRAKNLKFRISAEYLNDAVGQEDIAIYLTKVTCDDKVVSFVLDGAGLIASGVVDFPVTRGCMARYRVKSGGDLSFEAVTTRQRVGGRGGMRVTTRTPSYEIRIRHSLNYNNGRETVNNIDLLYKVEIKETQDLQN